MRSRAHWNASHRWYLLAPMKRLALAPLAALLSLLAPAPARACCPAPPSGKPVVNADQTVILLWDAATKTQHFVRRATFKSQADDFGFLVPTPAQPELAESGDDAFPFLQKLTEPERKKMARPSQGCGCTRGLSKSSAVAPAPQVTVLEEKTVAGFQASVLDAKSAKDLVAWLKDHGYAFSPEVEAWAKPYVDGGWKITALRVAKDPAIREQAKVAAASLRLSFKTEQPLFPYREPESAAAAGALGATDRLLRIYFIGDARYAGALSTPGAWTGQAVWSNKLDAGARRRALELLKLPDTTGPAAWWLTEFEDHWPYKVAPSDLTFAKAPDQTTLAREPVIEYTLAPTRGMDGTPWALAGAFAIVLRSRRRARDR